MDNDEFIKQTAMEIVDKVFAIIENRICDKTSLETEEEYVQMQVAIIEALRKQLNNEADMLVIESNWEL
jgi:hypothetical protein